MSIKFERVPYQQFKKDLYDCTREYIDFMSDEVIHDMYNKIQLPKRATSGSAGYDFVTPIKIELSAPFDRYGMHVIKIPTGIRCMMPKDVVLMLYPRSGLGFKYGTRLNNTVGIIDSDYYNAENYGHIMAKIKTDDRNLTLNAGDRFMQGVFVNYLVTDDDDANGERTGGFGSTGVQ